MNLLQHVKHYSHIDVCKEHVLVPKHFDKLIQLLSIEEFKIWGRKNPFENVSGMSTGDTMTTEHHHIKRKAFHKKWGKRDGMGEYRWIYHWGMNTKTWCYRGIYQILEVNEAILRSTSYMCIHVGKAAIQFVGLIWEHTIERIRCHQ